MLLLVLTVSIVHRSCQVQVEVLDLSALFTIFIRLSPQLEFTSLSTSTYRLYTYMACFILIQEYRSHDIFFNFIKPFFFVKGFLSILTKA